MQMRIMLHTVPRPARRSAMHSRCQRCVHASSTPRPAFLSDQQPVDAGMDAETTVMVHTFIFSTPHAYSLHPMPKPLPEPLSFQTMYWYIGSTGCRKASRNFFDLGSLQESSMVIYRLTR